MTHSEDDSLTSNEQQTEQEQEEQEDEDDNDEHGNEEKNDLTILSTPRKRNPRQCLAIGCNKCSQGLIFFFQMIFFIFLTEIFVCLGSTKYCIAHGGGRRCTFPGCHKAARDKQFCAGHGGGRRCTHEDCKKAAVGGSYYCTSHGGGKKCSVEGCDKSAQSPTPYCVRHGGGKTCKHEGCRKVFFQISHFKN